MLGLHLASPDAQQGVAKPKQRTVGWRSRDRSSRDSSDATPAPSEWPVSTSSYPAAVSCCSGTCNRGWCGLQPGAAGCNRTPLD